MSSSVLQLADVVSLSEDAMRDELARIGLSSTGMESELRARLVRYFTNALQHNDVLSSATTTATTAQSVIPTRVVANRFAQQQQEQQARARRQTQDGVDEALQAFTASLMPEETDARTKDGHKIKMKTFVRAESAAAYVPQSVVLGGAAQQQHEHEHHQHHHGVQKKRRMMDELKDEFSRRQGGAGSQPQQQNQQQQNQQQQYHGPGSWTPNFYLGNVHVDAHEEALYRLFSMFGEVESVKIMWPRVGEVLSAPRQSHGAFVSMFHKDDAALAFRYLQNRYVFDRQFRLEWSKPPSTQPPPISLESLLAQKRAKVPHSASVFVLPPPDPSLHSFVDETAEMVARRGQSYETFLMSDTSNTDFDWLRDAPDSPCYQYYQWRKFAFENGDSVSEWRGEPLVFGGVTWYPPPAIEPFYLRQREGSPSTGTDNTLRPIQAAVGSGANVEGLRGHERRQLESLLNEVSPERSTIGVVMVFAMDHADKASEVVQIISERLTSAATPIAAKIVYLFVISDILHNCGNADIPKAAHYRTAFESRLPGVMQCFNDALNATTSRISSQLLKDRVLQVLRVWHTWSLFSDIFITGLQTTFLAAPIDVAAVQPAAVVNVESVMAADDDDDDLDGAPISAHELPSEFDALDDRQLRIKCRTMGVPEGERKDMLMRLKIATIVASQVTVATTAIAMQPPPPPPPTATAAADDDDDDIDGMPL
jgi:hypothetical protein